MSIEFPPDPKQVRKEIHKALKPFGLTAADPVGAVMDAVVSPLLEELEATAADASRRFEQWQEERQRADANVRLAHEASNHELWRERAERERDDARRELAEALDRIAELERGGTMTVQYPSDLGTCETPVELDGTTDVVKVEHLAPAEWPPRSGDIWRDRARVLWFARDHYDVVGAEPMRTMAPLVTGPYGLDELTPDDLMEAFGPLTLVHRKEGEQHG